MTTKLFNTSIIQKGSEFILVSYGSEKPHYPGFIDEERRMINSWKKSKQETLIHPSQVEAFRELAWRKSQSNSINFGAAFISGEPFNIPSDNIYIDWSTDPNKIEPLKLYAFLRLKEDSKQEETQSKLWSDLFNDLDIWSRSCKGSLDTPRKIKELAEKFIITKR